MAKDNRPLRLGDIARPELGAGEANPFAENTGPPPEDEPKFAEGETYRVGDYETTVGHRGGFLLLIGLAAICSSLGLLTMAYFYVDDRELLLLMQPFVALLFGLPSWLLGRNDLRAMQLGAMEQGGQVKTRIAMVCGMIATASVAILFLWFIFAMFASRLGIKI
ncbi:hypothetical protein [Blastopirellula marina]|uniref:Uncharacterized protein n=1 Tax=Blastopirellula marina DSM 3645 TaxID=314230 RepID=A4A002_9BACT|nr:hypothetical protein [Blastopirellula marina]EAQ77949.1 hypothetical protein DSM3645_27261 [Blastopirellula marina DSM 3645]